ncbi:MAG: glycine radical domain-containing protein [Methanobrevibacter sp.]|nr:glycine radical domain-containing protein [Methanobrevibacter sp.]
MQLNIVSSEILIKAKKNPQDYPNLIVRVWGFSAYFNDLPNDYQDLLIKRAIENERKNN